MPDTNLFSELITFIRSETDRHLNKLDIPEEPTFVYDPIRYVLAGKGKRLRPILVHLSGRGFDADPEDLMHAGLAVELLHNFTLVHDDIMDKDNTRHGQPTVHEQFGNEAAILAGDSIFTLGQLLIGQVQANTVQAVLAYNKASLEVCAGQAFDLQFEGDAATTLDQYLDMVGKKTGALLSLCAELGGILGGQSNDVCTALQNFGFNLGSAFQVQDDILEIFSDAENLGKSLDSDVIAEKQTILTVLARKHDGWDKIAGSDDDVAVKREQMRSFFTETGVYERAGEMSSDFISRAKDSLSVFSGDHKGNMEQFTDLVLNRTH
jgi:geranylgeranyl pyrophosphate synthase